MPALTFLSQYRGYLVEKRSSKNPETFGHGNIAGLVAPEVAKNACILGDLIPHSRLDSRILVTALFLAAMIMHAFSRAPISSKLRGSSLSIFAGILFAQIAFFVLGLLFARYFALTVLARMPSSCP